MEVLNDKEAKSYEGGALTLAGWSVIGGGIISFFLGVFNGLTSGITCKR